jgi:myo-inositol-1(or 4)-monophosphatase
MKSVLEWKEFLTQVVQKTDSFLQPHLGQLSSQVQLTQGACGDITCMIDKLAEDFLLEQIGLFLEPCQIFTEERGVVFLHSKNHDLTLPKLIIDPIDGTTNAMRGIPCACISIALAFGNNSTDIALGIICNPFTHDIYTAIRGQGAFKNNLPIYCASTNAIENAVVGFDILHKNGLDEFQKVWPNLLRGVSKLRLLGSTAYEMCLLAQGSLDLYIDLRNVVRCVDIAAGMLIFEEAGGIIHFLKYPNSPIPLDLDSHYSLIMTVSGLNEQIRTRIKDYQKNNYK